MGLGPGTIVNQMQGAGIQDAGGKVVQVGTDTYMIVSPPTGALPRGLFPQGTSYSSRDIQTGENAGVTSGEYTQGGENSGATTGAFDTETIRSLPPDVRARLLGMIDQLTGRTDFGMTPEELARIQISPEQAAGIIGQAQRPVIGEANKASDRLLMAAAARGGYAPGLNATTERIQQEAGRQSSEAALAARLGVEAANRQAGLAAANARLANESDVRNQIGGLLTGFGESTTRGSGTSSGTSSGTYTGRGTSSGTTSETTSRTEEKSGSEGPANTQDLVPGGIPTGGGGGSGSNLNVAKGLGGQGGRSNPVKKPKLGSATFLP